MAVKNTKRELTKYLKSLTPAELVKEIQMLYSKYKIVEDYYALELGGEEKSLQMLADYKVKIKKHYFPTRGYGNPKAAALRAIISEFKKLTPYPMHIADLMIYRVEQAVEFTEDYGDIDGSFYTTTENCFYDAMNLVKEEHLQAFFQTRCRELINKSSCCGWGFYDTLNKFYDIAYD